MKKLSAFFKQSFIQAIKLIPFPVIVVICFALGLVVTVIDSFIGFSRRSK